MLSTRMIILIVSAIACMLLLLPAAFAADYNAKQISLYDDTSGTILMQRDADVKMAPSSMSKLMTLYVLFDRLKQGAITLQDTFVVSETAWRMAGSKMFVDINSHVSVEDLIRGIVVVSGNDACIVVAEGLGATESGFAEIMNATAKKLGLTGSHFVNSTGWPDENHYMTANDLVKLAHHLIHDFPEYYHYFSEKEFTYNKITQQNRNLLLGKSLGVDGLKTGHTEVAGYGIVLSALEAKSGRRLILAINGLDSMKNREIEGQNLLQFGFSNFKTVEIFEKDFVVDQLPIRYGSSDSVNLITSEPLKVTLPYAEAEGLRAEIHYLSPVKAPIAAGQEMGAIKLFAKDREIKSVPLLAAEEVDTSSFLHRATQNIGYLMGN